MAAQQAERRRMAVDTRGEQTWRNGRMNPSTSYSKRIEPG